MSNQTGHQETNLPLAEHEALANNSLLICDAREETPPIVNQGSLSEAVSGAVAEVLAGRFVKAITGMALGGTVSEDAVYSASAVEASGHAQPTSVSSPDVAAVPPHTCGRQVQAVMHAYDRD